MYEFFFVHKPSGELPTSRKDFFTYLIFMTETRGVPVVTTSGNIPIRKIFFGSRSFAIDTAAVTAIIKTLIGHKQLDE
jgi:hypothetical protein